MNIDQLEDALIDRSVAIQVITWLRHNELLADNSGNVDKDIKLAEEFAFLGSDKVTLDKIKQVLLESKTKR